MALQALLLAAAVTICVIIGRGFQLAISPGDAIAISVALVLMGLDFGLMTMAVGAATGRRGTALGVGAGVAAASYLLSSLASTISWIRPGRYLSLFYWSVGNDQISRGSQPRRLRRLDRGRPGGPACCRSRLPPG